MPPASLLPSFLLLVVGLSSAVSPTPSPATPRDTTGLLHLVGTWVGNGTGPTGIIRDSLTFAPSLGGQALRFTMVSRTNDGFVAEGYVWGTGPGLVELIETSSVDPMRRFRGSSDERGLVLDEEPASQATRVRLDLFGTDSLRLQEISTRVQPPRPFVDEMFVRVAR